MKNYILLITMHADPAMPPGYGECGGTQTYMKELLDEFGKREIHCILVTRKSMQYLPTEERYNSSCQIIRLINGDDEPMSKLLLYRYHEKNVRELSNIITSQEEPPSIIHSVYWNSGRLAMELADKFRIPFVHSVISNSKGRVSRGAEEPMKERAIYEQEIYNQAEKILCVSEDEKKDLERFYHISPDKLVVCGQYVDTSFVTPAHDINGFPNMNSQITDEEQKLISNKYNNALHYTSKEHYWLYKAFTYFGRLDFNKGILHILEAWYFCYKRYSEICPPLWIIGGSLIDIDTIRKKALIIMPELAKLEQNYKIIWWGYLNPLGLSTLLLKTQVVLMHSLYEPGGRVAVEAMSEGIPVIATPYGFAKDSIKDWKNGFLVEHGDVQMLSERMEHFIRQPLLSNLLGENARQSAKDIIYNWDFMRNHLQAYGMVEALEKDNCTCSERQVYGSGYSVNIFPYCMTTLSDDYLKNIFLSFSNEKILSIERPSSMHSTINERIITTQKHHYMIKQIEQQFSEEPLYNPFAKENLANDVDMLFRTADIMYTRIQSNVLLGADPFHHLFYFNELCIPERNGKNFWIRCLHTLYQRPNIMNGLEKKTYIHLIEQPLKDEKAIENMLRQLSNVFSEFHFSYSGLFSEKIAWKIAPFILEYNKHILGSILYEELFKISYYFSMAKSSLNSCKIRAIMPSLSQNDFWQYENHLEILGYENMSVGIIETEIASLLYNYYKTNDLNCLDAFWTEVSSELCSFEINMQMLFSAFTYRIFRDTIRLAVIHHKNVKPQVKLLNEMKKRMEM